MPVVFIGHGSPVNAIADNEATRSWQRFGQTIAKPQAILSISAHWCTRGTAVTAMLQPKTIHDFGRSLPAALFDLQYPAAGDPELAQWVAGLLAPVDVTLDQSWGLDHGTWSVLLKMYPQADIPVIQLSMDLSQPLAWHVKIGKKLQPLRDEGVLIMATGNIVHNLSIMEWNEQAEPYDWAVRFNEYIKNNILSYNIDNICNYAEFGESAMLSVPGTDHYCPLLYALGARYADDKISLLSDYIVYRSLSMTSVVFGEYN